MKKHPRNTLFDETSDQPATSIDLTSLLDVVFIMLIFFVVTATFIRETGLDSLAPDDGPPMPTPTTENIHVVIDDRDGVAVEGRAVDPRRLPAALAALSAVNPQAKVIIEPAPGSTVQLTVTAIDAALRAGIAEYRIARAD